MSIDTVRISAKAKVTTTTWAESEVKAIAMQTGEVRRKLITKGKGEEGKTLPRLTYYPDQERLIAEVSLPKFSRGENFTVLNDDDLRSALDRLVEWTADTTHVTAPALGDWRVSRLDGCWAWEVGGHMQAYLEALAQLPVHGYQRVSYALGDNSAPGFTWSAKTLRVNAYDKGRESNRPEAQGLLRLETQALNSSACKTLARRQKCEPTAANVIRGDVGRREVANWLKRINMPEAISAKGSVLDKLLNEFSFDDAASRYLFIMVYRERGHSVKQLCHESTYHRRKSEAIKRGWLVEGSEGELPGLKVPVGEAGKEGVAPRVLLGATLAPLQVRPVAEPGRSDPARKGASKAKRGGVCKTKSASG